MELDYDVTYYTKKPRVSSERTVEVAKLQPPSRSATPIVYKFARVGECLDVWEFIEVDANGDTIQNPESAFTKQTATAVLKKTPCVSIRDGDNSTIADIGYADFVDSTNHLID